MSVIVPVFNSQSTLRELDARIARSLEGMEEVVFETIYVDDASTDGSSDLLDALAGERPSSTVVHLVPNRGQATAILAGLAESQGEIIVTLDDDLGHPPEAIPRLVAAIEAGNDVAYGAIGRRSQGPVRHTSAMAIRAVLGLSMGHRMGMAVSPFRAFRSELLRTPALPRSAPSVDLLLARRSTSFTSVPIDSGPEPTSPGQSRYTVPRLLLLAARMGAVSAQIRLRRGRAPAPAAAPTPAPVSSDPTRVA